jgi:RNA polymerase sigma-70 factor (ECF subfamily)
MQLASDTTYQLEVHALRPYLLKFANLQLRDPHLAEDVVSETVVAALMKPDAFQGRSQLKTYLVGILKFKILNQFRTQRHLVEQTDPEDHADWVEDLMFKEDGHFVKPPEHWSDPFGQLQTRQFFEVLELCLSQMPRQMARIFMMREWLELSTDQISTELALSTSNLHVSLHRARLRLRECLEQRWFSARETSE